MQENFIENSPNTVVIEKAFEEAVISSTFSQSTPMEGFVMLRKGWVCPIMLHTNEPLQPLKLDRNSRAVRSDETGLNLDMRIGGRTLISSVDDKIFNYNQRIDESMKRGLADIVDEEIQCFFVNPETLINDSLEVIINHIEKHGPRFIDDHTRDFDTSELLGFAILANDFICPVYKNKKFILKRLYVSGTDSHLHKSLMAVGLMMDTTDKSAAEAVRYYNDNAYTGEVLKIIDFIESDNTNIVS